MKKWLKEYKMKIVLSMVLTMLPSIIGLLLWNQLPDTMTSHWGADGVADGTASKVFMVFGMPAILAGLNVVCILATALDPKQAGQNKKAMSIMFWIMPLISVAIMSSVYAVSLGRAVDVFVVMPLLVGVMFVAMGNYMPKVKQNARMGVKIYWTLHNEENWNKTHRFAGKIWVIGGVVVMLTALLPSKWMVSVLIPMILLLAFAPMVYSYCIYRRHKREGIDYSAPPATKSQKMVKWLSLVLVLAILAGTAMLMFTGDIFYTITDDALRIENSYVNGLELSYEDMDSIELRDSFDVGVRAAGFGSPRLSMGAFQNGEFELYTLYSYNSCDSMILIRSAGKVLAFNCATAQETEELYKLLLIKCGSN